MRSIFFASLVLAGTLAATAADPSVHMRDSLFKPTAVTVPVGTTLTFSNDDEIPHNVTGDGLKSGDIDGGKQWQFTFSRAATYHFVCTYHPWMKGTITVAPAQ